VVPKRRVEDVVRSLLLRRDRLVADRAAWVPRILLGADRRKIHWVDSDVRKMDHWNIPGAVHYYSNSVRLPAIFASEAHSDHGSVGTRDQSVAAVDNWSWDRRAVADHSKRSKTHGRRIETVGDGS
jgi:hypothetical protein